MKAILTMTEPKQVIISDKSFYIFPFPAFKAAKVLGDLQGAAAPIVGALGLAAASGGANVLDKELADFLPAFTQGMASLTGDKVESLLKELLTSKNVSAELDEGDPVWLTEEITNRIFCGCTEDMFELAFHVIKLNYSGFFDKMSSLFGAAIETTMQKMLSSTESSTPATSPMSNSDSTL